MRVGHIILLCRIHICQASARTMPCRSNGPLITTHFGILQINCLLFNSYYHTLLNEATMYVHPPYNKSHQVNKNFQHHIPFSFFPGVRYEGEHWSPASSEVKNAWSYISTLTMPSASLSRRTDLHHLYHTSAGTLWLLAFLDTLYFNPPMTKRFKF
jgi:hypothetical protein